MTAPPPTPEATLRRARKIGFDQGLNYVYAGNRPGSGGEDTACPGCGLTLIARQGFRITANRLSTGRCPDCGLAIAGVWR
jgi:pyruvate formate lyase activating enzyme